MSDLRSITKQILLKKMLAAVDGWKLLVVDEEAMRVISSCCKMFDIMEEGVTCVDPLHQKRQRLPQMKSIYFLEATAKSITRLIEDFSDDSKPYYSSVYVFFTGHISDKQFARIKGADLLLKRLKDVTELHLDYCVYERSVFHLNRPQSLVKLFSPTSTKKEREQALIAERLVSLCASLEEFPQIRHATNHPLAASLARRVAKRLGEYAAASKDWKPALGEQQATLLIVDRTEDMLAPLLHEFTYQAMIYDLIEGVEPHVKFKLAEDAAKGDEARLADTYTYTIASNKGGKSTKVALLGEHDQLYTELRHAHIADASDQIVTKTNSFMKTNKAAAYKKKPSMSFDEMRELISSMPDYQEILGKIQMHTYLASQLMDVYNKADLEMVALLEQALATGEDENGKPLKSPMAGLSPLLSDDKVDERTKLRLVMIYAISQDGIDEKLRKKLMQIAQFNATQEQALLNLSHLGVQLSRAGVKGAKKAKEKKKKGKKAAIEADVSYDVSRFSPALKSVIRDLASDTLDESTFPTLPASTTLASKKGTLGKKGKSGGMGTSLRTTAPKWAGGNSSKKKNKKGSNNSSQRSGAGGSGPRLIVFVAGGVTFSEIRSAYEVANATGRDILIGSTAILTPNALLDNLVELQPPPTSEDNNGLDSETE